ncbi:WXG100 family type VII secretion target [Kineosporia babensis]|uniref:Outer membrane channel protein CpnT-like N-terminal domain-containing protein n=1 Tax=Kineosporia babensis TaxID=499548 RepID=A0A9X1N9X2_9ACTN|nr:hypothetical protein [Kineosporia babensis]MCD5309989.1 hypothetical protein [Kineosporia babensis]
MADLDAALGWVWDKLVWGAAWQAWPDGDPDAWRELGDAWGELAMALDEAFLEMNNSVGEVAFNWGGSAGQAFTQRWNDLVQNQESGPPAYSAAAYAYQAASLNGATELEYAQLMLKIIVGITAAELVFAAAFGPAGASYAALAVSFGRAAIIRILSRLATRMAMPVLRRTLLEASELAALKALPKVAAPAAAKAAAPKLALPAAAKAAAPAAAKAVTPATLRTNLLKAAGAGAGLGAAQFGGADLLAQAIQVAEGNRKGINYKSVFVSTLSGGMAGAVAGPAGLLFSNGAGRLLRPLGAKSANGTLPAFLKVGPAAALGRVGIERTSLVVGEGLADIPAGAAVDLTQNYLTNGKFGFSKDYLNLYNDGVLKALGNQFLAGAFGAGLQIGAHDLGRALPLARNTPATGALSPTETGLPATGVDHPADVPTSTIGLSPSAPELPGTTNRTSSETGSGTGRTPTAPRQPSGGSIVIDSPRGTSTESSGGAGTSRSADGSPSKTSAEARTADPSPRREDTSPNQEPAPSEKNHQPATPETPSGPTVTDQPVGFADDSPSRSDTGTGPDHPNANKSPDRTNADGASLLTEPGDQHLTQRDDRTTHDPADGVREEARTRSDFHNDRFRTSTSEVLAQTGSRLDDVIRRLESHPGEHRVEQIRSLRDLQDGATRLEHLATDVRRGDREISDLVAQVREHSAAVNEYGDRFRDRPDDSNKSNVIPAWKDVHGLDPLDRVELAHRSVDIDPGTRRLDVLDQAIGRAIVHDVLGEEFSRHVGNTLRDAIPKDEHLARGQVPADVYARDLAWLREPGGNGAYNSATGVTYIDMGTTGAGRSLTTVVSTAVHESMHALQPSRDVLRSDLTRDLLLENPDLTPAELNAALSPFNARLTFESEFRAFTMQQDFLRGMAKHSPKGYSEDLRVPDESRERAADSPGQIAHHVHTKYPASRNLDGVDPLRDHPELHDTAAIVEQARLAILDHYDHGRPGRFSGPLTREIADRRGIDLEDVRRRQALTAKTPAHPVLEKEISGDARNQEDTTEHQNPGKIFQALAGGGTDDRSAPGPRSSTVSPLTENLGSERSSGPPPRAVSTEPGLAPAGIGEPRLVPWDADPAVTDFTAMEFERRPAERRAPHPQLLSGDSNSTVLRNTPAALEAMIADLQQLGAQREPQTQALREIQQRARTLLDTSDEVKHGRAPLSDLILQVRDHSTSIRSYTETFERRGYDYDAEGALRPSWEHVVGLDLLDRAALAHRGIEMDSDTLRVSVVDQAVIRIITEDTLGPTISEHVGQTVATAIPNDLDVARTLVPPGTFASDEDFYKAFDPGALGAFDPATRLTSIGLSLNGVPRTVTDVAGTMVHESIHALQPNRTLISSQLMADLKDGLPHLDKEVLRTSVATVMNRLTAESELRTHLVQREFLRRMAGESGRYQDDQRVPRDSRDRATLSFKETMEDIRQRYRLEGLLPPNDFPHGRMPWSQAPTAAGTGRENDPLRLYTVATDDPQALLRAVEFAIIRSQEGEPGRYFSVVTENIDAHLADGITNALAYRLTHDFPPDQARSRAAETAQDYIRRHPFDLDALQRKQSGFALPQQNDPPSFRPGQIISALAADASDAPAPATSADGPASGTWNEQEHELPPSRPELAALTWIRGELLHSPELADVLSKLVLDHQHHRLNLTGNLLEPGRR